MSVDTNCERRVEVPVSLLRWATRKLREQFPDNKGGVRELEFLAARTAEEVSAEFRSTPEGERLYQEAAARLDAQEATPSGIPQSILRIACVAYNGATGCRETPNTIGLEAAIGAVLAVKHPELKNTSTGGDSSTKTVATDGLVARLREWHGDGAGCVGSVSRWSLLREAADRIAALTAENERLRVELAGANDLIAGRVSVVKLEDL